MSKFHYYWEKFATSKVNTGFYNSHIWKAVPAPISFQQINVLTKFHEDWKKCDLRSVNKVILSPYIGNIPAPWWPRFLTERNHSRTFMILYILSIKIIVDNSTC
ncbi:hypothetical protein DPMN_046181 [Dreissena polymorpha]|uniref:Uncharacterized protein n=1 Tax=Dreissena polymorpha TaxID=45954 RepID=A0A9D4D5Q6_DREPO|nr:hypothetical protein DPMN_046181 [Dreissena polymorpha]